MTSYTRNFFTLTARQRPTIGDIKMGIVNRDHLGWLICDGRALSVQQYYQLWEVIGYSFTPAGQPDTLFYLPNPAGTVPGIAGQGTDSRMSTFTFSTGQQYGEYQHILSIPEMPAHNHYGNTSNMSTGITILNNSTNIYLTDPGHAHSYLGVQSQGAASGGDNVAENNPRPTETTGVSTTGITLTDPKHKHDYTDPQHYHAFSTSYTGGDLPHNNVQPTLTIGNMFIFSGYYRNTNGQTDPLLWPYAVGTNLL
jgi:microcystin-dependent protein